jgi:hypothetical protein
VPVPATLPAYIADYVAFNVAGSFAGGGAVPGWVLSGATVDMDFANGRYFGDTLANLLSITRASNATDLLPSSASGYAYNTFGSNVLAISPTFGLLIFEARTNQLLNSTAPATQTTASLGTGSYTLWVNGSGSALASAGTATVTGAASATNGTPNTFTVTVAGTVTVTVTGSLNAFQLEAGASGTSFIVTAGATASRAADNITIGGAAIPLVSANAFSVAAQTNFVVNTGGAVDRFIFGTNSFSAILKVPSGFTTLVNTYDGSFNHSAVLGSGTWAGVVKSGMSLNQSGTALSIVANNGTVATFSDNWTITQGFAGNRAATDSYLNGVIIRLTVWNNKLADATLKAFTA